MTGLELAATVRDLSPVTGILFMSANCFDGNDVLAHAHLRKPFSAKQLIAAVAATMGPCGLQ
jgi:CheY-like chemotaxis protein